MDDPSVERRQQMLANVEVEVRVRVGRTTRTLGSLRTLAPGDMFDLSTPYSEPVAIVAGDTVVARGEVVVVQDDHYGVRVTDNGTTPPDNSSAVSGRPSDSPTDRPSGAPEA